ncbi:MAG TPA: VOC family protein [Pseudonocardiaceae bacterium]
MNRIDHVLYAVHDLDAAAERLRREYGWGVAPGGSPAPGVRNAVVPLAPPLYLELVTVTDPEAGPGATQLAKRLADGEGPFTWALEPDDLDGVAQRLGLTPDGSDGNTGTWRIVGEVTRHRPFFIDYGVPRYEREPSWRRTYERVAHDRPPGGFTFVAAGPGTTEWVGETDVDLRVGAELTIGIASADGEIVLR